MQTLEAIHSAHHIQLWTLLLVLIVCHLRQHILRTLMYMVCLYFHYIYHCFTVIVLPWSLPE